MVTTVPVVNVDHLPRPIDSTLLWVDSQDLKSPLASSFSSLFPDPPPTPPDIRKFSSPLSLPARIPLSPSDTKLSLSLDGGDLPPSLSLGLSLIPSPSASQQPLPRTELKESLTSIPLSPLAPPSGVPDDIPSSISLRDSKPSKTLL